MLLAPPLAEVSSLLAEPREWVPGEPRMLSTHPTTVTWFRSAKKFSINFRLASEYVHRCSVARGGRTCDAEKDYNPAVSHGMR